MRVSLYTPLLLYMKWNHKIFIFSSLILLAVKVYENVLKKMTLKMIWQVGGGEVIALFRFSVEEGP